MTNKLENLLRESLNWKTKNCKKIATALLENKELNRIKKIATFCNVSYSSVDRFIKQLGYPSFKHFVYEYENEEDFKNKSLDNLIFKYQQQGQDIAKKITGKIFIATSRKDKCIGKFLNERLNDENIKHEYFFESKNNISTFVENVIDEKGTLILISFFPYSKLFNNFLQEISSVQSKPNVIIITNAKWIDVFEKYNYVSIGQISKKNYDIEKFDEYNHFLSEVFVLFFAILSEIWKISKKVSS